jgi:pantoate kinase
MKKTEFRNAVRELIDESVDGVNFDEKLSIIRNCLIEAQTKINRDETNKGKPYSDDELRHILRQAPTKENCINLARTFKRGYGSIEQIFRWASSTKDEVGEKRGNDAFIQQIKRIAKEIGWRAT